MLLNKIPSYISISVNVAILLTTGTVMSSNIENINDWLPKLPEVPATGPFLSVNADGAGVIFVVSIKKLTVALAAFFDAYGLYRSFPYL